jgi:hypothetical protein
VMLVAFIKVAERAELDIKSCLKSDRSLVLCRSSLRLMSWADARPSAAPAVRRWRRRILIVVQDGRACRAGLEGVHYYISQHRPRHCLRQKPSCSSVVPHSHASGNPNPESFSPRPRSGSLAFDKMKFQPTLVVEQTACSWHSPII